MTPEQKFTDEDLKLLKDSLDTYVDEQQQCYRVKEFKALLSRLDTAEELRKHGENLFIELRIRLAREIEEKKFPRDSRPDTYLKQWERYVEAWRKAAGK